MTGITESLVSYLVSKGLTREHAEAQVFEWTGRTQAQETKDTVASVRRKLIGRTPRFLSTGEFPEEHGRGQF